MPRPIEDSPRHSGRSWRRALFAATIVLFVVWMVAAALQVRGAASDARDGMDAMDTLTESSNDISQVLDSIGDSASALGTDEIVETLGAASVDFASAEQRLDSAVVTPLRYVPVLGRQLDSVRSLSSAAAAVTDGASTAVDELDSTLDQAETDQVSRSVVIGQTETILASLETDIEDLDLGPDEGLVGPLRDARDRFASEYDEMLDTVSQTRLAVSGVGRFLDGPTRYVLLGANNAEMRAGSGMVLQAGALEVNDGQFAVEDLQPTEDLRLGAPVAQADEDLERNWGILDPDREWRNINLTPRFDVSARIASDMWTQRTGETADGVMSVDIVALAELLELTGPVTLPTGETVTAENVKSDLLLNQYLEFTDDRDARRDRLGVIAAATFSALNERSVSAGELLEVLRDLGRSRHLLMWSPEPAQQEAWEALGTDGTPGPEDLLLSVMNRGANKLDPFLGVSATVTTEPGDESDRLTVDVSMTNNTPTGLPTYVAGPVEETGAQEGEYKGIVALTLPGEAGKVLISGGTPAALGPDGNSTIAATEVLVPRGETAMVSFSFDVPTDLEKIEILAGARVPPTEWTVGDRQFTDARSHTVTLPD